MNCSTSHFNMLVQIVIFSYMRGDGSGKKSIYSHCAYCGFFGWNLTWCFLCSFAKRTSALQDHAISYRLLLISIFITHDAIFRQPKSTSLSMYLFLRRNSTLLLFSFLVIIRLHLIFYFNDTIFLTVSPITTKNDVIHCPAALTASWNIL